MCARIWARRGCFIGKEEEEEEEEEKNGGATA
jgi:hypothetical protein